MKCSRGLLFFLPPEGLWASPSSDHRVQPHRGRGKLQRGGSERREGRGEAGAGAPPGHPQRAQPCQGKLLVGGCGAFADP